MLDGRWSAGDRRRRCAGIRQGTVEMMNYEKFRAYFQSAALVALAGFGVALAQSPAGLPSVGPGSSFNLQIESYFFNDYPVTVAALSGCSTGGSPSVLGNQKLFLVTAGTTTSTTCTITWPVPRNTSPPICAVTAANAAAQSGGVVAITTNSTTAFTWTWSTTQSSTAWDVICMGPR